jgi:hypothetical protein
MHGIGTKNCLSLGFKGLVNIRCAYSVEDRGGKSLEFVEQFIEWYVSVGGKTALINCASNRRVEKRMELIHVR